MKVPVREFPVIEDPDHPGWLLYKREYFEIDRWLERKQKRLLSRLLAIPGHSNGIILVAASRKMNPETKTILGEIQRRKDAKQDLCESCDGSGRSANDSEATPPACGHFLGQGVLLTTREYELLIELGKPPEDDILDSEILL